MNECLINNCYSILKEVVSCKRIEFSTTAIISSLLISRKADAHKGDFGHALLIAGSKGMAGASLLSARACLRSGVGLLTIHAPWANNDILQLGIPEAIVDLDSDECHYSDYVNTDRYSALGIGPGLGRNKHTISALCAQVIEDGKPMVLDADALNIISENRQLLSKIPPMTILTPHPKELERLVGSYLNKKEMYEKAIELSNRNSLVIVVKGAPSVTIIPDGTAYINTTGNSGMATGGSGDVLTGIVLSLLAQGYNPKDAGRIAVFIHGLAGDIAAADLGERSLIAGDLIDYLPKAWHEINENI